MIPRSSTLTALASAAFCSPCEYAEMLPRAYALPAAASRDAILIDFLPRASARGVVIESDSATGAQLQYAGLQPHYKNCSRFVYSQRFLSLFL